MNDRLYEIWTLYVRELRSALRERNIVIYSIILPILLYPGLLWIAYSGISFVTGQTERMVSRVEIHPVPPEHQALISFLDGQDTIEILSGTVSVDDLVSGKADAILAFSTPRDTSVTRVHLQYDGAREGSRNARFRLQNYISEYRDRYTLDRVRQAGVERADIQQLWIETQNLADGNTMGRFLLGLFVPFLVLVMLAVGAVYPAIDSTAGERENATWETLMTVAVPRSSILIGKYLYVSTMSFVAGMLNVVAMAVALSIILEPLVGDTVPELSMALPVTSVAVMAVGAALMALFLSAGMMILASFARTFREGQSMFGPLYVILLIPVVFLQIPDLRLTPQLAVIPIVNVALMFRDAIEGIYQWHLIGITVVVELGTIILALGLANKILAREDFLVGGSSATLGRFLKGAFLGRRVAQ